MNWIIHALSRERARELSTPVTAFVTFAS